MAKQQPAADIGVGKVHAGDCITQMNAWPAASVDLIFADPPYNIGYNYDQYEDNQSYDAYVKWTGDWITACARLLRQSGSFYILIGDEYAAETRMALRRLERDRMLLLRNWIIWHYTFGQNCKLKFNRSHAHLFYCVGPGVYPQLSRPAKAKASSKAADPTPRYQIATKNPPFTFNRQAIAVPSARQTTYGDSRANPNGKLPDDVWYLRPQEAEGDYFRDGEDTWYHSRLCGTFNEREQWHPCQLPESLLERIIRVSSNPGELVFDPFTGSGTTLAVARRLERQWVGCELSEEYAQQAQRRVEQTEALPAGDGDDKRPPSDAAVNVVEQSGRKADAPRLF